MENIEQQIHQQIDQQIELIDRQVMGNQTVQKKKKPRKKPLYREITELVFIFFLMLFIFNFVLMSVKVNGTSMVPTYHDGERGIMVRILPFNEPTHGDVVVIDYTDELTGKNELIVKRVFAMPNDTFEIKDNEIFVNGEIVDDPHRAPNTRMDDYPLTIMASDEAFVLGDHRNVSKDSRMIGPIKIEQIKAVHGVIFWPIGNIGIME